MEHMRVVPAFRQLDRQPDHSRLLQREQLLIISIPYGKPLPGDPVGLLELGVKKSGNQFARNVTGSDIHPGVFVDHSAEEPGTVCTFFPDDLRPFEKPFVIDDQRAAFA